MTTETWQPKTLEEALECFKCWRSERNLEAIRPFVEHYTEPVCLGVSEKGEKGEKGFVSEYLVWVPEKQELQFHRLIAL